MEKLRAYLIIATLVFFSLRSPTLNDWVLQWKTGLRENPERLDLGIPILPQGWRFSHTCKQYNTWYGDEKLIKNGHFMKLLFMKGYDVIAEKDYYKRASDGNDYECIAISRGVLSDTSDYGEYYFVRFKVQPGYHLKKDTLPVEDAKNRLSTWGIRYE